MLNSSRVACALVLAIGALGARAQAQRQTQGFGVERFQPSAAGGAWWVMDALEMHGGLGGALALTLGYASQPLRVTDGTRHLAVVSDQAFATASAALTYDRWRFYLDLTMPLATYGQSGVVGDYSFAGPSVNPGANPDLLADARLGVDVRLVGRAGAPFRFGAGAQLWAPFGNRADYVTDGTFRGMLRALFAGDAGHFTWAGHLGVHIRPLDDSPAPGSPKGSELLFGVAAGAKLPLGRGRSWAAGVGPELYGATAFRSFLTANGTALEGLLTGRIEGTRRDTLQMRVKLGVGGGLCQHFGAPEWRLLVAVELFNHNDRQAIGP